MFLILENGQLVLDKSVIFLKIALKTFSEKGTGSDFFYRLEK